MTYVLPITSVFSQPILESDSLYPGPSFNLYTLSNVNTANLSSSGANVAWDVSSATASLTGTADFLAMSSTSLATQYPAANFAIKFTSASQSVYSLFNKTSLILEEVANNVGTPNAISFTDYRTSLVFPFTYGLATSDTYQKSSQSTKSITITYDAYGTFSTSTTTYSNVARLTQVDNGSTSINWWTSSPVAPLLQGNSSGFVLWKHTSTATSIKEMASNFLFDLYPNPSTNELHIINKEMITKLEIYNLSGQLQLSTTSSNIDISILNSGIYFLKAFSEKGNVIQKFVKQ